jgi:hypothetical protein
MKRFAGIFILLLLASISIAGCYGDSGGCPHGVCDEAHSPKAPEN